MLKVGLGVKMAKKCDFAHTFLIDTFTILVIRKTFQTPPMVLFVEKLGMLVGWVVFFFQYDFQSSNFF